MNKGFFQKLTMVKKALILILLIAVLLTLLACKWLSDYFPLPPDENLRIQYLEQYVGVVQIIAIGIVVTLVSVIIPLMLPELRDRFERYKESRLAYSRAKTAVLYLPDRVINTDEDKVFQLVEEAHRQLHFAETFEDMIIDKGYLKWFKNPSLWIPYNYWQIVAVAEVLRSSKIDWNVPENKDVHRVRLNETVGVVHQYFGRTGENCMKEDWDTKDGARLKKEEKLHQRIKETAVQNSCQVSGGKIPK